MISVPITSPLPQPMDGALTGAHMRARSPRMISGRPTRSSRGRGPRLSVNMTAAATADTTPMGTLIQKIHCQFDALNDRAAEQRCRGDAETGDTAQIPIAVPRF